MKVTNVTTANDEYARFIPDAEQSLPKVERFEAEKLPILIEGTPAFFGSKVFIDGREIRNISDMSVVFRVGEPVKLKLEILALNGIEINGFADIEAFVHHVGKQPDGTFIGSKSPMPIAGEALKLECGSTYAIECAEHLSRDSFLEVSKRLIEAGERFGVTFLLLGKGMKIARTIEPRFKDHVGDTDITDLR